MAFQGTLSKCHCTRTILYSRMQENSLDLVQPESRFEYSTKYNSRSESEYSTISISSLSFALFEILQFPIQSTPFNAKDRFPPHLASNIECQTKVELGLAKNDLDIISFICKQVYFSPLLTFGINETAGTGWLLSPICWFKANKLLAFFEFSHFENYYTPEN